MTHADLRPTSATDTTAVDGAALLRSYVAIFRRRAGIIVTATVLGFVGAAAYAVTRDVPYTSSATILLIQVEGDTDPGGGRARSINMDNQVVIARSSEVIESLAEQLGVAPRLARSSSAAVPASEGDILHLSYSDGDPVTAANAAALYARTFLAERASTAQGSIDASRAELQRSIDDTQATLDDVLETLASTKDVDRIARLEGRREALIDEIVGLEASLAEIATDVTAGVVTRPPELPAPHGARDSLVLAVAGAALGLMIGLFVALLRDRLDPRLRVVPDLDELSIPEIARLRPVAPDLVLDRRARPDVEQAHLKVLLHLEALGRRAERPPCVLLAPIDSHGPSAEMASNVAAALAALGVREGFDVDLVFSAGDVSTIRRIRALRGSINARTTDRITVVLTPPLAESADALALAGSVDQVIVVVDGHTRIPTLLRVRGELVTIGSEIHGAIRLIGRSRRMPPELDLATWAIRRPTHQEPSWPECAPATTEAGDGAVTRDDDLAYQRYGIF
jgi:capsular polysaccharide biosynthesis protein